MDENKLDKFTKPYDPVNTEGRIYKMWEDGKWFTPETYIEKGIINADAPKFSMVVPPPNVTGVLHMGHGMMLSIEDMVVRFKRMRGYRTLWLPGTDHAAIATQVKVEKELGKLGIKKSDLSREEFLGKVNDFAMESQSTILSQFKAMGASLDWTRLAFTLDDKRNLAVKTVFKKMYEDGLIYRGFRIVNWDPKGQTVIADDEIVHEEREAMLYTFKYSHDFPISISTTRPETKVGDVAVAVHPDDARYSQYVGQVFTIPDFCGVELNIQIIADESVDKEFGTGALGVTPAHSQIDAEIAERHNLQSIPVINEFAKITVGNEKILNKKTTEAREVVVEFLRENNLLEKEEKVKQNISTAERTGGIIEPLPKMQWFVAVNKEFTIPDSKIPGIVSGEKTTLKEIMRRAVDSGAINIIPEYFDKTYFHWIDNLRDWCISRQIWYGHRIPVWYKDGETCCGIDAPTGDGWTQDEDTLDTWFSSALWTFSTLGWPENSEDLKIYHPTDLVETGYEILFFWVARMILMSGYVMGDIPFKTIYLHGTVRDAQGRKMSKSLGNGIDPMDIAAKYGADAGRMALVAGTAPGTDSRISEDKIKGYKHFGNKLWNITRFVTTATQNIDTKNKSFTELDSTRSVEWHSIVHSITSDIENYRLHLAIEKIYDYTWKTFADVILEESKDIFANGTEEEVTSRAKFLNQTLDEILKTLHPFMPFVTEEIWQTIHTDSLPLIASPWVILD